MADIEVYFTVDIVEIVRVLAQALWEGAASTPMEPMLPNNIMGYGDTTFSVDHKQIQIGISTHTLHKMQKVGA